MSKTVIKIAIFAISFAFIEAAVVVYLRHLLGIGFSPPHIDRSEILFLTPGIAFLEPQTAVKIISNTQILNVERIREAATLVILGSVALISAKRIKDQIAYFFLSFGIWDIFYYLFLRLTIGWPRNFLDLDIFFLLPTPWIGPVIVPILISTVLISGSLAYILRRSK